MNKTATDLEQSRKLAEILPIETADMQWIKISDEDYPDAYRMGVLANTELIEEGDIPSWSLTALLNIIPYNITFNKAVYRFKLVKFSEHWECYHENFGTVSTNIFEADNPIDVCYGMVIFLHDKNLI